jgi:hypothetical protein
MNPTSIIQARIHASDIAERMSAAYWLTDRDQGTADYLIAEANLSFARLAEAMGCELTPISEDAE